MLQRLATKAIDEKLRLVEFGDRLFRKIDGVTSSPRFVMRMTETILDCQNFILSVTAFVRKKSEIAVDVESKKRD